MSVVHSELHFSDTDGTLHQVAVKAWIWEEEPQNATWELRRIATALFPPWGCDDLKSYIRRRQEQWREVCELFDLNFNECFIPSARSLGMADHPLKHTVKKEWSITSAGLLSLCVGQGVLGWKREEQLRAAVVLNCLLVNIVEPSIERTLLPVRESVDLDVQQACEEYNVLYATCPHIAALHLSTCIAATPQSRIATGMLDAFKGMARCCSVKAWLRHCCRALSSHMDLRVSELGWETDCLKIKQLSSRSKQRRLDEDLCAAALNKTHALGMASTLGALGRSTETLSKSSCRDVIERRLESALFDSWQQAQKTQLLSISLSLDAKKLGQPFEETLCFACWDCVDEVSYVPPPQAPPETQIPLAQHTSTGRRAPLFWNAAEIFAPIYFLEIEPVQKSIFWTTYRSRKSLFWISGPAKCQKNEGETHF